MDEWDDPAIKSSKAYILMCRLLPPSMKLQLMGEINRFVRLRHAAEFRASYPGATDEDILMDWADRTGVGELLRKAKAQRAAEEADTSVVIVSPSGATEA